MRAERSRAWLGGLLALGWLAACEHPLPPPTAAEEPPVQAKTVEPVKIAPSEASRSLASYYRGIELDLRSRGLMRTDGGGKDTPYTDNDLLRNFERIAFYDEYAQGGGFRPSSGNPTGLRKWVEPVRISITFGPSVPEEQRLSDAAIIEAFANRLARITRHPISKVDSAPNFHVLIMGQDDRDTALAQIRRIVPEAGPSTLSIFRDMPRSIHCLVVAFSDHENDFTYRKAIAFIRAEHPPLLFQSCVHEELAQGLGLADDSPTARPSIFNDDDEFALLTGHDEKLLRLLYHPELKPGMTPEEALPILRRLLDTGSGGV